MNTSKNTKRVKLCAGHRRGSLAVETAIILPLFIIGILTLGYLIKLTMTSEGIFHALADETGKFTAEMALPFEIAPYEKDVASRAARESLGDATGLEVRGLYHTPYFGKNGKMYTNLVGVSVTWETPVKLPRLTSARLLGQATILARAFVGSSNSGTVLPFGEMEKEDAGGKVWVFPRAGERYHAEDCSYIHNNPRERLLDRTVRGQYDACSQCGAASAHDGDLVYCFPASGRVFHTGDCYQVERYVIEIDKADAEKQGYTACSKCGGG